MWSRLRNPSSWPMRSFLSHALISSFFINLDCLAVLPTASLSFWHNALCLGCFPSSGRRSATLWSPKWSWKQVGIRVLPTHCTFTPPGERECPPMEWLSLQWYLLAFGQHSDLSLDSPSWPLQPGIVVSLNQDCTETCFCHHFPGLKFIPALPGTLIAN